MGEGKRHRITRCLLKSRIAVLIVCFMMILSGCGSNDYILEIGNGYAICRYSLTERGLSYNPSYNGEVWESRIEDYYVLSYFVYDEYIGLQGCYIPQLPNLSDKLNYLSNLTVEDYYFYLVNSTDDMLSGPWRNENDFWEHCETIGITNSSWIEFDNA